MTALFSGVPAVFRHELAILRRDPFPLVLMFVMPVVVAFFLAPSYRSPGSSGSGGLASGSVQAIPGMTVTFAFFAIAVTGLSIFREHGWQTWDRLRASSLRPVDLLIGKAFVPVALVGLQFLALTAVGAALFGMPMRGSWPAALLIGAVFGITLTTLGMMVVGLARTWPQVNAVSNLCVIGLGGLGGGFTPVSQLSPWARTIAPATPSYWAIRSLRATIQGDGEWHQLLVASAVLTGYSALFATVACLRLRRNNRKQVSWA